MAQPSVINYFNTRKRPAVDELNRNNAKKALLFDEDNPKLVVNNLVETCIEIRNEVCVLNNNVFEAKTHEKDGKINLASRKVVKSTSTPKMKKIKAIPNQANIEQMLSNMSHSVKPINEDKHEEQLNTPPGTPTKKGSAMEKIVLTGTEPTLAQLKQKLSRSSRLAELKASLARFKQSEKQLEEAEKKTKQIKEKNSTVALKDFKAIELEVNLSPQKVASPEKSYLSPKKDASMTVRKNLFATASPVRKEILSPVRESLTLPYKYRCLAEIFRAIDTVCQIMHNRKETITFKKLKPAVEEMLKRTCSEKHLSQIKHLYPDSFIFKQEKLRQFGTGIRCERWELVLVPKLEQSVMTSEILLERRRKLFKILIDKVRDYHREFLTTLDPPIEIPFDKITRWHPQFDIEKVPDIEVDVLPQPPNEEKFTTGSEVLEKARSMFNCNTRMERALEKLKQSQEISKAAPQEVVQESILKGIPKTLLEKVRQRQAAKALESMTRSTAKDKEVELYSQLPEIARFARNVFVTEKKSVLPLDLVIDKLCNSYRAFRSKDDMETYLRAIAKETDGWLVFHEIRSNVFIKLNKKSDLSLIMNKLKILAEQKAA